MKIYTKVSQLKFLFVQVHFQSTDWLDHKKLLKSDAVPSLLCVDHNHDHDQNLSTVEKFKNYDQVRCFRSQQPSSKPDPDNSLKFDQIMLQKQKDDLEVQLQVLKDILHLK